VNRISNGSNWRCNYGEHGYDVNNSFLWFSCNFGTIYNIENELDEEKDAPEDHLRVAPLGARIDGAIPFKVLHAKVTFIRVKLLNLCYLVINDLSVISFASIATSADHVPK